MEQVDLLHEDYKIVVVKKATREELGKGLYKSSVVVSCNNLLFYCSETFYHGANPVPSQTLGLSEKGQEQLSTLPKKVQELLFSEARIYMGRARCSGDEDCSTPF